ncbi:MAG: tRNA (cytidine(56)-2'-O)-methyltransferase, partial [Candidatus Nanohaloarchaea archaeon]
MIKVLRLGHRAGRDDRISTHVGLVARQFGVEKVYFSGEKDTNMLESIRDIVDRWGGDFEVEYTESWRTVIKDFDGFVCHLTMYGERIDDKISFLKDKYDSEDFLIVVGSEKVPREVYKLSDL